MPVTARRSPPRRSFRFGLFSLLLVVTAIALLVGVVAAKFRAVGRQRAAVEAIQRAGGAAVYGHEHYISGRYGGRTRRPISFFDTPPGPAWLRAWVGQDFFAQVESVHLWDEWVQPTGEPAFEVERHVTPEQLAQLRDFPALKSVTLSVLSTRDPGLSELASLARLESLTLREGGISDASIADLATLKQLRRLELISTQVTPAGAAELTARLPACAINLLP